MLELKFKQIVFTFDFSFFAVVSLMLLFRDNQYVLLCLLACMWHETGHLLVMLINNVKVKRILFYGGGIKIIPDKSFDFTQLKVRVSVLLAGSALNYITFMLLKNSASDVWTFFATANAIIGAFNMLPLQFLDGGKILVMIIRNLCSYNNSILLERYLKWLNIILIITIILIFSFIGKGNITLFFTLCCLLLSALFDG